MQMQQIIKRLTKRETHNRSPVIRGRNGLTYTPLDKATANVEVCGGQFLPSVEEQTYVNFYLQIRTEANTYLQTQPPLLHELRFRE